jgi:hypothetical protein
MRGVDGGEVSEWSSVGSTCARMLVLDVSSCYVDRTIKTEINARTG